MSDLKEETICIKFSPQEKAQIEAAAEVHDMELTDFVKMLVMYAMEQK